MDHGQRAAAEAMAAERVAAVLAPQPAFDLGAAELIGLPAQKRQVSARGPGRPPGARNRRPEDLAAEVEARFGNGVLRGYALATMDAEDLAARLGCTVLEAIQEQRLWLAVVAPYVHQRQPLAVNVAGALPLLVMADPRSFVAPADVQGEIEEIQAVGEG